MGKTAHAFMLDAIARTVEQVEQDDDFDRFFDPMAEFEITDAPERIAEIVQAVQVLASSSLISRPVKSGQRELVIGTGTRGCVALYRFVADVDTVFVLALRSQRATGFKRLR